MKRILVLWAAILLFVSCQQQELANKQELVKPVRKVTQIFSLTDSLTKYQKADSLLEIGANLSYVGTINKMGFALVRISDSTTAFYQKKGVGWFMIYKLHFALSSVTISDLNGDDFKDIIMTYEITGIGGNSENISLLYYPELHKFKHNASFDLPNIRYDKNTHLIHSAWWSGIVHPQNKTTYRVYGDSLVLKDGVTYEPDGATRGNTATIKFYTMRDSHQFINKKIKGDADKLFSTFSKALWDTSDEF